MTGNAHRTLERIADRVPVPEPAYERLIRRRERKERNRRIRAGTLALVIAVLGAAIFLRAFRAEPFPADRPVQPSPSEHGDEQPPRRSPIEGLEFPMLGGARPSTPITGDAVVTFLSWPSGGYPVEMAIYADGRVIWHPDQNDVGYLQLRLTPAGVDTIRSMISSTGLFDHNGDIRRLGVMSRLTIQRGDRSVFVQWANGSWLHGGPDNHHATPSESRDLTRIQRLLGDPSAWQLSADLYADPVVSPFVPSGFSLDSERDTVDLSQLPSPARDLLARDYGSANCPGVVTTDEARRIARALGRAGFAPHTNTPSYLDWILPGESGGMSNLHLSGDLPHDLNCDSSG